MEIEHFPTPAINPNGFSISNNDNDYDSDSDSITKLMPQKKYLFTFNYVSS